MDAEQRAICHANGITAIAANRAVIRLHAVLAAAGILSNAHVEALRHAHLHDFDALFDDTSNAAVRKHLEEAREVLDALWQAAVQVPLPGAGPRP